MFKFVKNLYGSYRQKKAKENGEMSWNNDTEEVYYQLSSAQPDSVQAYVYEHFIIVKDENIGKRLYNVLEYINKNKANFSNKGGYLTLESFTLEEVFYDKNKIVKWFRVRTKTPLLYLKGDPVISLAEIIYFVSAMHSNKLFLDDSIVNFDCDSFSEFLSYFVQTTENEKEENKKTLKCVLEYIHYACSGGNTLQETYEGLLENGDVHIYNATEFPYQVEVVKLCYEYFKTGEIREDLLNYLDNYVGTEFSTCSNAEKYMIAFEKEFETDAVSVEKCDNYTVYDGTIKIHNNIPFELSDFLYWAELEHIADFTYYNPKKIIISLSNCCAIGYVTSKKIDYKIERSYKKISEIRFSSQKDIVLFVKTLSYFVDYIKTEFNKNRTCSIDGYTNFDFEESILYIEAKHFEEFSMSQLRFITVEALFAFLNNSKEKLCQKITKLFYDLLLNFITQKYGTMNSEKDLMKLLEVRSLRPSIATNFIIYVLQNKVVYSNDFTEFLYSIKNGSTICYDNNFDYNPETIPAIFDYEATQKYNIKIENGTTTILPDGRQVTILEKRKRKSPKSILDEALREISICTNIEENEHIKFARISEMIYSQNVTSNNMYKIVGYITEPVHGNKLTTKLLMTMSNKELYEVAGYLFSKFYTDNGRCKFINLDSIYMDENFVFYICPLSDSFAIEVLKSNNKKGKGNLIFCKEKFIELLEKGYNENARECLLGLPEETYGSSEQLLKLAESFDSYCTEHSLFYDIHSKQCPICSKTKYIVPKDYDKAFKQVFEDQYAVHYSIDENNNLKVYKPSCPNMPEIQKNVSRIINIHNKKRQLHQDCFIPTKKAFSENGELIGYVYDAVKFEVAEDKNELCTDINNIQQLSNLPRLMSIIRLLTQVDEIIVEGRGFIVNPFTHVFLNKDHKKQVQILNIEFLHIADEAETTQWKIADTTNALEAKQWVIDYVTKVLQADSNIEIDIYVSKFLNLQDYALMLQTYAKSLTMHCTLHNLYYSNKYDFCPKCINPKIRLDISHKEKHYYTSRELINEGGESFIYPCPSAKHLVVKIFKDDQIDYNAKCVTLARICQKAYILNRINADTNYKFKYIIPQKLLAEESSNKIYGYTMERIQQGVPISSLKDIHYIEKIGFTRKDILEILITIGKGIMTLHKEANIYIGDLNGRNILFDTDKNVYFIDLDGMGVDEIAPDFCTDGYIDPVSKKNRNITMKDDWYSFAIQAFYYLTNTHPFNGIYFEERDGKKVKLDIPDKMERRISLLGNHGMKAPTIASNWNEWMTDELKQAFLSIFEGDNRESITPLLVKQYRKLYSDQSKESIQSTLSNPSTLNTPKEEIIRINSKFIAKKYVPFSGNVIHVFNQYSALCKDDKREKYIAIILKNNELTVERHISLEMLKSVRKVKDVLLTRNQKIAFVVYMCNEHGKYAIATIDVEANVCIDLKTYSYYESDGFPYYTEVVLREWQNESYIYILRHYNKDSFAQENEKSIYIEKRILSYQTDGSNCIAITNNTEQHEFKKGFWFNVNVTDNVEEFVFVTRISEDTEEVVFNNKTLCQIQNNALISEYNIIYDETAKLWLVLNTQGKGIVINSMGIYKRIDISRFVDNKTNNMLNIYFRKGRIYIPIQGCLHIENVLEESGFKDLECNGIIKPNTKIYDVNSKGFSVITDNTIFEITTE